jgi:hypothetical protein
MKRLILAIAVAIAVLLDPVAATAPQAWAAEGEARSKSAWPKPTRAPKAGEKVCKHRFSNGERTVWICEKAQPCCEWEALNFYVKCGSTVTGCL